MSVIACACGNKNRATASSVAAVSGTYRVYVGSKKVYETTSSAAADTVAARFDGSRILPPGIEA